jgi:hypothetical protein
MENALCGGCNRDLVEVAVTPRFYSSDAYDDVSSAIRHYYHCHSCNEVYHSKEEFGHNHMSTPLEKYTGRLSVGEIQKAALQGYHGVYIAELRDILNIYQNEKKAGLLRPVREHDLELEIAELLGYTDPRSVGLQNLHQAADRHTLIMDGKNYPSVLEYVIEVSIPMEISSLENLHEYWARLDDNVFGPGFTGR